MVRLTQSQMESQRQNIWTDSKIKSNINEHGIRLRAANNYLENQANCYTNLEQWIYYL